MTNGDYFDKKDTIGHGENQYVTLGKFDSI